MIEKIRCSRCGQIRRWDGFVCLDTCPCLTNENEAEKENTELKDRIVESEEEESS